MASPLAIGAGASEGLDNMLRRMLAEEAQAEAVRSNKAEEELKAKALLESSALRRQTMESTAADRASQAESRLRDDVRSNITLRPPNTEVSPTQRDFEVQHGAPEDFFLKRAVPDEQAVASGVPESLAQNDPNKSRFLFRGTAAALRQPTGSAGPVEDTPGGLMRVGPDNKAAPVLDADGKPVTRYHAPQQPDRVLIQTEGGYIPRADATARLRAGGNVPLPPTAATRTMSEGAKGIMPAISRVSAQAEDLDKAGLFGPLMGRVRDLATRLGTVKFLGSDNLDEQQKALDQLGNAIASEPTNDRRAGKFAAALGLLMTGAARVHGGARGGGSPTMIEHFKSILNSSGTLDLFQGRMEALMDVMKDYAAEGSGGGGKTDSTGLPEVGGTFQGGKVLKVTPIK